MKEPLTQARLKELLDYDPETGVFTHRVNHRNRRARAGLSAGTATKDGYLFLNVDGKAYYAHRLAFLWMEGAAPPAAVDHRNGSRVDNRWANLRKATWGENAQNRAVRVDNTSGITGVRPTRHGTWIASIKTRGVEQCKYFKTLDEAIQWRAQKVAELHPFAVPR